LVFTLVLLCNERRADLRDLRNERFRSNTSSATPEIIPWRINSKSGRDVGSRYQHFCMIAHVCAGHRSG
jgi:hypothetical protein